ncbi:uncharacterized protein DUF4230 [Ureibacillus xyleni]|uniref:Uncharacterized protein DUF4230 n=1 Tax=Ureibacillus xyleni TaxID=614648 RepID=A0A285T248_9BACL|nr:DUF4230 domain-containing protein [Ureibacillus xyleni]SOC15365.1 uncharacterized protein DUF4230 [Ureibacillus xyleni]
MSKKDKAFTPLESELKEINKSKEEIGVTTVSAQGRAHTNISGVKNFLIVLILIILTSGVTWILSESTQKKETTIFVEQIQELAMLATAEAKVTLVKEEVDHKLFGKDISVDFLPGTKREILLIVPATVIAGVDLKGLTSDDIKVSEDERELEIVLPRATFIQDPAIQMDSIKTFSDKGLLSGEVQWDEGFDLTAVAQDEIKEEAKEMGLLKTAEESAEKVLKGFFSNLDYTVKITFE